jgi:protein-disulfide isomerase
MRVGWSSTGAVARWGQSTRQRAVGHRRGNTFPKKRSARATLPRHMTPATRSTLRSTCIRLAIFPLGIALAACSKDKEPVTAEPAPAPKAPSSAPETPPKIDSSFLSAIGAQAGLTDREDDELASILSRLDAPCPSEAVSVAQCVAEHRSCPDCDRAARFLAIGVHQGWPAQYQVVAFRGRFDPKETHNLAIDGSPTLGPATAPITIVEFGSYVCPHCAAAAPRLEAVQKAHPGDVRLVFKPMWSPQNKDQVEATRAAFAAGAQGKFWEMHALLFANQPKFDPDSIDGYAKSIGLDTKKLRAAMASPVVTSQMNKDLAAATAAQIDSLPSIWINGHPYLSFENLEARIAFELANR